MSAGAWFELAVAAWPLMVAFAYHKVIRGPLGAFFASWLTGAVVITGLASLTGKIPVAAGSAASAIICLIAWWLSRRWHHKAVATLLGAKSRALRDALVRKQRELARPRPVLRPVPQGGAG